MACPHRRGGPRYVRSGVAPRRAGGGCEGDGNESTKCTTPPRRSGEPGAARQPLPPAKQTAKRPGGRQGRRNDPSQLSIIDPYQPQQHSERDRLGAAPAADLKWPLSCTGWAGPHSLMPNQIGVVGNPIGCGTVSRRLSVPTSGSHMAVLLSAPRCAAAVEVGAASESPPFRIPDRLPDTRIGPGLRGDSPAQASARAAAEISGRERHFEGVAADCSQVRRTLPSPGVQVAAHVKHGRPMPAALTS